MPKIIAILLIVTLSACVPQKDENPPADTLDRGEFALIMVDVQLIEAMRVHKLGPKRENTVDMDPLYEDIFRKHGTDKSEFLRTFDYYTEHPDLMMLVYEQVVDSLLAKEVIVKREYQESQMFKRDSTNRAEGRIKPDSIPGGLWKSDAPEKRVP